VTQILWENPLLASSMDNKIGWKKKKGNIFLFLFSA
jgi:hypothetical protein